VRILWLKTELLHPVDKGGKIRTYHMLKALKREHQVTYLTLDDGTAAPDAEARAEEYCQKLVRVPHRTRPKFSAGFYGELASNLFSPLPYFMKKYQSEEMQREITRVVAGEQFDVLVCDFLQPSVNVPPSLPVSTVLFQHNVEAMIWKRHYEVQTNPVKKTYLYGQWRKADAYERAACHRFDHIIAVSREDRETMERVYGLASVSDVPTGVDTDYFRPGAHRRDGNGSNVRRQSHNLVFTGSMDWLPNEDAIQYFTREIMPLVKAQVPDMTLTIVGRNPYASLLELSRRDPSVVVTGRVEDVRPYIDEAAAYVVPLRIGGGTRLKIYEAMAMEQPIISTTIGAEGLPVQHGSHLLLADTPQDFAAAVVSVLRNQSLARTLSASAAQLVRAEFGWEQASRKFAEICCAAIRRKDAASRPQIEKQESKRSLL